MPVRHCLPAVLMCLVLATLVQAQAPRAGARVQPMTHRPVVEGDHKGHDAASQTASLSNDQITYGLLYNSCWDASHAPGGAVGEAYLGMSQPTSANWYQGGFLHLKINGQDLGLAKLSDLWIAEQGPRATLKFYYDHPQAAVLISATLYAADNRLFVNLGLTPRTEIKTLDLGLLSYPSYFTYWNKRNGDRKGMTATATYPQADGKKVALDPRSQPWIAFYDTIFDPAKGEGDGGCAVAFLPEQVLSAETVVGSYACTVDLKVKPDTRNIRLCFWDFNKQGNQEALTALTAALPQTLERMRAMSFLPLAISEYDVAAKADLARTQLAGLPGRQPLEQRLATQSAELLRLRQDLLDNKVPDPAAVEKTLTEKMAAFEQLLWDVRFFVLING